MTAAAGSDLVRSWARLALVLVLAILCIAAAALVALDTGGVLRAALVFSFFVFGPGFALTGYVRLPDWLTEVAVAVPVSLALNAGVAAVMTFTHSWRPGTALIVSAIVTYLLLLGQLVRVSRLLRRSKPWRRRFEQAGAAPTIGGVTST
jgi:hypothetical protein